MPAHSVPNPRGNHLAQSHPKLGSGFPDTTQWHRSISPYSEGGVPCAGAWRGGGGGGSPCPPPAVRWVVGLTQVPTPPPSRDTVQRPAAHHGVEQRDSVPDVQLLVRELLRPRQQHLQRQHKEGDANASELGLENRFEDQPAKPWVKRTIKQEYLRYFLRKFLWPTGAWHLDDGGGPPGPPVPLHHPDVDERLPELLVLRNTPTTGGAGGGAVGISLL